MKFNDIFPDWGLLYVGCNNAHDYTQIAEQLQKLHSVVKIVIYFIRHTEWLGGMHNMTAVLALY